MGGDGTEDMGSEHGGHVLRVHREYRGDTWQGYSGLSGTHKKDISPSCLLYPSMSRQIPDVRPPISMKDIVLSEVKYLCARWCVGRLC